MSYETITTVCPYCGTGCLIDCTVDRENNRVIEAKGSPHGVNNDGRLCLKAPLEPATWEEAIQYTADRLKAIIKEYGPDTVMGAGSARGPGNEVGYLTQKFMRAVIGTNNVDHCARI